MTRSAALARIGLNWGRWLLPWIAVLLVSATLAHAMSRAIAGGASPSDRPAGVQAAECAGASPATVTRPSLDSQDVDEQDFRVRLLAQGRAAACTDSAATGAATREQSTTSLSAASADPSSSPIPKPCAVIGGRPMSVGVDWWIVAESTKIACESAGP